MHGVVIQPLSEANPNERLFQDMFDWGSGWLDFFRVLFFGCFD